MTALYLHAVHRLTAQHFDEKEQKQLAMIEHVLSQAQSEMRALLLHLRPISLENKSLS